MHVDTVRLGRRTVSRVGISVAELRVTGMWGEPTSRAAAVAAIRAAVEGGVDVLEVPVPFGPYADLVRAARVPDAFVIARLTARVPDLDTIVHRLGGRRPDLILAEEHFLDDMRTWGVPLGAIVGSRSQRAIFRPLYAVRGPFPALRRMVEWCEVEGVPYMAGSTAILAAGRWTIALPAPRGVTDVERLLGETAASPPAEGPE
jgi:hypothetical protein